MRSRRTTFSTSIDLSKPVEKLVDELSSNLDPNNSSNTQLDRIECVKNFLIRFKFHFNQAPSQQQQQTALNRILVNEIDESSSIAYNVAPKSTKNVDQQFEAALEEKCESISIGLVYSIIQSESTQLRLLALQTILLLSHFRSFALRFHQLNTNLYVVRLIDLDLSWDEASLCFEYIRLLTQLWPSHLDKAIVYCLLSALEDAKYKLNYLILETLLEIVCRRPSLACECSVFNELITYVLNASNENEFIIELVMQTLVRACDDERIRCQIPIYNIFSNLIAPLIDTAYVPFTYGSSYAQHTTRNAAPTTTNNNPYSSFIDSGSSEGGEPKFESVVTCAFTALGSLMSTYTGVMCFLINDGRLVYDLLAPLSWYLNANKRDADKRQALAEQVTAGSADTSNNAPPLQNTNQAAPEGNNASRKNSDPKELMAKQKELFILNGFISFFYKLFSIEEISTKKLIAKAFRCMGRSLSVGSSSQHQQQYMSFYDLTEEDFVNNECEALFDSFENYSAQSNMNNLEASAYTSTSPNLTICHRIFLLKTFIEARLLESLLDLYFGLPVSFLENSSLFSSSSTSNPSCLPPSNNLLAQYELLSLKCLHLFSELYYMGNRLLHNEYCIDDLDPNTTKCPFTANSKSIYNEMKKLSLIGYLRQLNYLEREKEVLIYVTDLNTKKESIRRGEMLPSDEIVHMSFFAQQFLANSGHLSSKKFHQELEMLNSTLSISPQNNKTRGQGNTGVMNEPYLQNIFHMVSNVFVTSGEESAQTRERKETKTRLAEIEKKLDEQLDSTQILTADLNISSSNTNNTSWNWLEIIKLFELFLLEHSSFYPRFEPSRDAEFLRKHKRKLFSADSQKLIKVVKKLFDFFSLTSSDSTSSGGLSSSPGHSHLGVNVASNQLSYSPRVSSHFHMPRLSQGIIIPPPALQQQGGPNNLSDQISCVGCYLIDFCLDEIEIENIAQNQFSSIVEFLFVQLLQSIRQYLLNEYPLNAQQQLHQSNSFLTVNHAQTTQLHHSLNSRASMMSTMSSRSAGGGKDSILANYLLFLGHMSANPKGDLLLEHFKIYDLMVKIVEIHRDHSFIKLATSTLNYYTSPKSRLVLERALCSRVPQSVKSGYNDLKIYMIKLVLNLFRAHNLKFDSFFLRILIRSMSFALDDEETSPLMRFSNEQVLELIIGAVEYVVNLRPDLLDRLLNLDKDDELVRSVDELVFKCSAGATKSRLIRARLEFLSVRLKLSESKLAKMSKQQLENMVKSWYNMKKDLKHMKLVERSLFDANSLNSLYMSEIDDRIDDPVYDTVQPMSSLSYTPVTNFSLDESSPSPLTRSRSNTASNAAQLQPSVKLYRRINDPNRNFTRFQTSLAQIYMPFHINTAIVRHAGFVANNFNLDEFFDEKTVEQLEIIKAASFGGHTQKVSRARLKTALWSISSLCICENGFRMLSRVSQSHGVFGNLFELACCFVKLAEECAWLSIRATCFLCSNLVCKSSTGANLWGKLGWHTFQSNLFTPTRAFHSTVASLSAEQQDLSVASSIDIAVIIYNLNRAKLNRLGLTMKSIQKYYFYEFSDYELRFLNEISRTDLASKKDIELIREYNHSEEIGTGGGTYFAENLTVPIRMTLLSPEDDFKKMSSILSHQEQQQQHQNDNEAEFDCKSANCFYCCYLLKSDEGKTSSVGDEERRKMAHDFITKLMFMLNIDKSKMKKLISLRKFHPSVFNFCFYYLVSTKYLSCYRLKFHVRKSIQELFFDVFKSFVENSRS